MKILLGLAVLVLTFGIATCTSRGVDAPVALDAEYAAREQSMKVDTDRCGPAFVQDKLPKHLLTAIGPVVDGPFRPVCARHDACYRLGEKSQTWCDDRMRTEMLTICESGDSTLAYSVPIIGPSLCSFHAGLYFRAIDNTFGALSYEGLPGGSIERVVIKQIDDRVSDDEITLCVTVINDTPLLQEYDVELHTSEGKLVDREPDTHERNVRAGEKSEFCVGTNFSPLWSRKNLGNTVYVSVRADTPNSFRFWNDIVIVDSQAVTLPN